MWAPASSPSPTLPCYRDTLVQERPPYQAEMDAAPDAVSHSSPECTLPPGYPLGTDRLFLRLILMDGVGEGCWSSWKSNSRDARILLG